MHVCDNGSPGLPTMRPEVAEPAAVDDDDAGPQRVRVDVVIEDEFLDPSRIAGRAQQKGAALAPTPGAPPQFRDPRPPDLCAA